MKKFLNPFVGVGQTLARGHGLHEDRCRLLQHLSGLSRRALPQIHHFGFQCSGRTGCKELAFQLQKEDISIFFLG